MSYSIFLEPIFLLAKHLLSGKDFPVMTLGVYDSPYYLFIDEILF